MRAPGFLAEQPRIALFALLATFSSGFGQTFFAAVFGGELRAAFELSHTHYGLIYGGATVISALFLLQAGTLADRWPLAHVASLALLFLAAGCLLIGLAWTPLVLALGFVLIRFGGQGMSAHIGLTAAGRHFNAHRGKAVAFTAGGFPLGEATLPAIAVALMAFGGWRTPWLAAAGVLILLMIPLLRWLSREAPSPRASAVDSQTDDTATPAATWSRARVLRERGFWMLLPAAIAAPFTVTTLLFHQAAIAEARDWSLELVAGAFVVFAAGHLLALLIAGPAVDRIGAQRILPAGLLPMFGGTVLLATGTGNWVVFGYLALVGTTLGLTATAGGALWAERYGVRYLGGIRALAQSAMILATAAAPVVGGMLLDSVAGVIGLAWLMAAITAGSCVLALMAPRRPALPATS